jgi:hypothetical protein
LSPHYPFGSWPLKKTLVGRIPRPNPPIPRSRLAIRARMEELRRRSGFQSTMPSVVVCSGMHFSRWTLPCPASAAAAASRHRRQGICYFVTHGGRREPQSVGHYSTTSGASVPRGFLCRTLQSECLVMLLFFLAAAAMLETL